MDLLSLLGRNGFLPHGYCFTWSPGILWTMVGSDAIIAAAYFAIPAGILVFARRRPDPRVRRVAGLFGAFIVACGVTHLMDIWTIWRPDYALQALTKVATAAISLTTAIAAWRLLPALLALPSSEQLHAAFRHLEVETSERRTAQEQAADVERSLALTLAVIDAGLITTDRHGNVATMNAVAERITGWSQEEARGRSYWEVFAADDRPADFAGRTVVDAVARSAVGIEVPHRVMARSRKGVVTTVEARGALLHDDDGGVRGVLAVLRDMTQGDQAELGMRRLAAIVESSSDAIIGKSLDGRITSWNRAATTLFGYSESEAIGASVQMLIPPDKAAEEMAILSDIVHGRVVAPFNTVRLTKSGRLIDVSITISPIRDASGAIVGGSKIARDMTAQLRAAAALRESENRLRFALSVAEIGDWDVDVRTGAINRSLRHDICFGYDELQPEWDVEKSLRHIHPDDQADVARAIRTALTGGGDLQVEFRVIWPDKSLHWIRSHGSSRYESGETNRMLGIVMDVTERKLAEQMRLRAQKLESDNRQIVESNRLKSQFLANMSHELRSPLNAIIGFSDILYSDASPTSLPTQHKFIGHIRTSGRHLLQLINDVLDLSKVESGKFEFFPEPVDLSAVLAEVNGVLFTPVHKKRLTLEVDIDPAVNDVTADPARLKQALYNYLSNAIKFTPEGGRIQVRAVRQGLHRFRVEVEDTGIGIAEADLSKLFVEFQQLDGGLTKQHQGTGLGLALTRRLVEAQGGTVGVRSTPGRGSVFHLSLPIRPDAPPEPDTAGHFLVIEDREPDRSRIADVLTGCGHHVDVAASAADAIRHAASNTYDAMTLDLMLDRQHGLATLDRIRRGGTNSRVPVVAVTIGAGSSGAASFSIDDVLAKPLRADELAAAVSRLESAKHPGAAIMVIDDEATALDLMTAALRDLGLQAHCYQDGRLALTELPLHRPAAIILDLMMPVFDGFQVLQELRATAAWRDIPVFVWTGMALADAEYDMLVANASAVVLKGGGGMEDLLDRLRRWRPVAAAHEASTS